MESVGFASCISTTPKQEPIWSNSNSIPTPRAANARWLSALMPVTSISSKNPSIRIRPSTGRPTAVSTSVRGSPQKFICTTRSSTRAISYGGPTRTIPRRRLTSSSVRVAIIPIASLLRARTGSTSRIRTFQSSTTRHSSMSTMPAKRFSQPIPTAAYIDTH